MEITFNSNGNEKQKLAYKLWSDKKTNDIVYGGSKGCLWGEARVCTRDGMKYLKDIHIGDIVLSYNEKDNKNEWKRVTNAFKYENNEDLMFLDFPTGDKVAATFNHLFYIGGRWQEAYK